MAYVENLQIPVEGMTEIINVGAKVGFDCPNRPHDVKAVQQLIALIVMGTRGVKLGVPAPTGEFDAVTGFHIYNIQHYARKKSPHTTVDGCVSPAKGLSYGGGIYSIVYLNAMAHSNNKQGYLKLLEPYRPV